MSTVNQFRSFAVVGVIGFAAHAAVFSFLLYVLVVGAIAAWLAAFSVAVVLTWLLNRHFVFQAKQLDMATLAAEYPRYLVIQGIGAAVNLGVFAVLLRVSPFVNVPLLALSAAAVCAAAVTFLGSRRWVFRDSVESAGGRHRE